MSSFSTTSLSATGGYSQIRPSATSYGVDFGQIETLLKTLSDPAQRDDLKLKALQDISDSFEVLITTPTYLPLVEHLLRIFIKLLQETTPQFIGENNTQQLRKLVLEIIHRMPCNEYMKMYAKTINTMLFQLVEKENEENVLVCLRIIIELEKQFRPPFGPEIQQFMNFAKSMYRELPLHVHNIFEPHPPLQVAEIQRFEVENALQTAYTIMQIHTQQKLPDGASIVYTLLPRGKQSLKVLAELPIIVVLLYQVHKVQVQQDMADFIPLVLSVIQLGPSQQQRSDPLFNRDIFIDFMAAQIKALSFMAFLGRVYQDAVNLQASGLVRGIMTLLATCPPEIAHLRKELLVAIRHILGTDLRMKFVPYVNQLFDENMLIGSGWTANENLRPLAYSTLADLVHHVRQQLPLQHLTAAVYLFAHCAHNPTITCGIQTMACKLLLNLVDCVSKQQESGGMGRELLFYMLDVFVRKFKVVATDYLPQMFEKCDKRRFEPVTSTVGTSGGTESNVTIGRHSISSTTETPNVEVRSCPADALFSDSEQKEVDSDKQLSMLMHSSNEKEEKCYFGSQSTSSLSLADVRALVKTLVCGVKTIAWGIGAGRVSGNESTFTQTKHLQPRDTAMFVRLLKYGLQSLDVYMISPASGSSAWQKRPHTSIVQSKDEKEVLDHFATLFTLLNLQTFKEIFSTNIEFLVDRISENLALQAVPHAFLVNVSTSPAFATILIDYLIKRLPVMGSHEEQSNLCLKLYKTVFGSVSLFAAENEQMLKPYLHRLVNSCLELSLTAKEPFNYFLLLRGLFRSIGGGSHDLLYQEFLPLLPGLLKNLNNLQNGYHRQQMKELLVELCLTVPVRLSSLVPHLPMLMEPLVSALSGSPSLVLQGLRTLELCIDNLQPEFLHEHMAPVRPQMMQALAKILNTPGNEQAATAAWRTIGKLGGLNRKMLTDVQILNYSNTTFAGPCLPVAYVENSSTIDIPLIKAIQYASSLLRQSATDLATRLRCFGMIRTFLISLISYSDDAVLENSEKWLYARFQNAEPIAVTSVYRCQDTMARSCCVDALTAALHAATSKDTRQEALPFVNNIIRYLTFLALCEQTGPQAIKEQSYYRMSSMDSNIVSDAIVNVMADEDKELCKAGILAITLVMDTSSSLLASKDKASQIPLMREICKSVVQLCYEPAWYSKLGGCSGIKYFLENLPRSWISSSTQVLAEALFYVFVDSMGQIANGALDIAKLNLQSLVKSLCQLETTAERDNALFIIVRALVPNMKSWSVFTRNEATALLELIAEQTGLTTSQLLLPHMEGTVLHFLGIPKGTMNDFTIHCRIGILAAFTYLINYQLPISKFDPCGESERNVFSELVNILEGDQTITQAVPGYEKEAEMSLTQLKIQAANAVLAWKDVKELRERTFSSLFKTLTSDMTELQDAAFECLQKFVNFANPETNMIHTAMRPLLLLLSDYKSLTLAVAKKLLYLTKLFPTTFNEKLCDQLLAHLKKWLEVAATSPPPKAMLQFVTPEMETCAVIVEIFHHIPAASARFVDALVPVLANGEAEMSIEVGSPWRSSMLKFLVKYPMQTVEYFLSEPNVTNEHMLKMFLWILKQESAKQCRDVLQSNPTYLFNILSRLNGNRDAALAGQDQLECITLRIVAVLASRDSDWLSKNVQLVEYLRNLWNNPEFRGKYNEDSCDTQKLKAPRSVIRCLFCYFQANPMEIGLLYDMLTCLTEKFSSEFEWLKRYLEKDVATGFSIEWKRQAFKLFLDMYGNQNIDIRLKIKVLQHVIIPCIHRSLEKGDVDQLIGSAPAPDVDTDNNLISAFVTKVIDTIDTQRLSSLPDILLILFYQLTCLFVEYAAPHIHDTNSKKQGTRLRKVMLFGWPCLQQNNSLDPSARYYGHLLIAHVIEKFAIHRKIVLQVFHSLLKAHGQEARHVVRHALNILTPAVPQRTDDGYVQLAQNMKKLIVEEGHSTAQLTHILQLVIRHYKLFFPIRHQLLQHLVNAMQKLVVQAGSVENKKLAVDLCETIIKWELCCLKKDDGESNEMDDEALQSVISKAKAQNEDAMKRIDKPIVETTLNFLLRLACYVPDQSTTSQSASGGAASMEALSKRCLQLIKAALKPDLWGLKADLKLQWLEKALANNVNEQTQNQNPTLACTCLDVLTYLVSVLPPSQIVNTIRPIQRGIAYCLVTQNNQIIKSLYNFFTKLFSVLYSEIPPIGSIDSFEPLGPSIQKTLAEAFGNYEKAPTLGVNGIYGSVTILKAVCSVEPSYVDRVMLPFVKALQKLAREHIALTNSETTKSSAEMLSLCLDILRSRLDSMNTELRKQFLQNVMYVLLEKSGNSKVILSIMKHLNDWMKLPPSALPLMRERQALLIKLSQCVEKRFASDGEIMKGFLDLVYFVYKNEQLRATDLPSKLEAAFLIGLCQSESEFRNKFFEVFDASIRKSPYERLVYIVCTQNWEPLQQHYWIKQCIELMLSIADRQRPIVLRNMPKFAPVTMNDVQSNGAMETNAAVKFEPADSYRQMSSDPSSESQELIDFDSGSVTTACSNVNEQLRNMWQKQVQFLTSSRNATISDFLPHFIELCHLNTDLAESVWISLLRNTFAILDDSQRQNLTNEVVPFLCSGTHIVQRNCSPSVLRSFVEAFNLCSPSIFIKPSLLQYLGRAHGLWHRSVLLLEKCLESIPLNVPLDSPDDPASAEKLEAFDSLSELYSSLNEQDLWASVWFQRARYPDTKNALRYEQIGIYDVAADMFEKTMMREQAEMSSSMMNLSIFQEMRLWEQHWARCLQELNQWESLKDLATTKTVQEPFLLLECAWRMPNWDLMKDALSQVEGFCPKELAWKIALYRGYFAVGNGDEQHLTNIDKVIETANQLLIKEWRRLPRVLSQAHAPLLQASQQVMELQEATQLLTTTQAITLNRPPNIHEMKSVVKTWRNRTPAVYDSLSHWSHVFAWRLHHYRLLVHTLESDPHQAQSSLLGVHASAQCLLQYAKTARRRGQLQLAVDILNRLHTIPNLPVIDSFQKLREQVKCCLKATSVTTKGSEANHGSLQEALDIIENSNISYFNKETNADLYALKGVIQSQMQRLDEATKSFSTSLQLNDGSYRAWASWGDHLEALYSRDRESSYASQALISYVQAARIVPELKARKFLVRTFWLLKFDNSGNIANEGFSKFALSMPSLNWLFWLPQLVMLLKETDIPVISDILINIGKAFPEAALLAIYPYVDNNSNESEGNWQAKCQKVLQTIADAHPCVSASLQRILSEMIDGFPQHWSEKVLIELRALLKECYRGAFDNRGDIQATGISPTVIERLGRVSSKFMNETDELATGLGNTFSTEFDVNVGTNRRLWSIIGKRGSGLVKWCEMIESRVSHLPKTFMLPEVSGYLASFCTKMTLIDMFGETLTPRMSQYCVKIAKFLPHVERVQRADLIAHRFWIRGNNGKKYPFLLVPLEDIFQVNAQQRVLQLFRMLNVYLAKNREAACRLLQFDVPIVVPVGPNYVLISDKENNITLLEFLKEHCKTQDVTVEDLVSRYYEKLLVQQARGSSLSQQVLLGIMKDITLLVPKSSLTNQLATLYPEATDYFTFRKQVCLHASVLNACEYLFSLSSVGTKEFTMSKETGLAHVEFFVPDATERFEEYSSRPVPFRLTPALVDFMGVTLHGYMAPAMTAVGRCFQQHQLHHWLRVLLWEHHQGKAAGKDQGASETVATSSKATAVLGFRLQTLSQLENVDGRCHALIAAACSTENLCRMDPAWHPWF